MDLPSHSASIVIERSPTEVYDMIADVTRMGEYSPVCRACWWDDPEAGARVGAWFNGRNELPDRTWETRSEVTEADPGERFTFVVSGNLVYWSYTMRPTDGDGTELTESWKILPGLVDLFNERYGDQAAAEIAERERLAHEGIPITLAAIKAAAER